MNRFPLLLAALRLAGCNRHPATAGSDLQGCTGGTSHDATLRQLERMHAVMLTHTRGLVRAQFSVKDMKGPMQVELTFRDDRLAAVNYIPQ
jgi:hypothetical protein